jgi:uracil-DNA glycosylase
MQGQADIFRSVVACPLSCSEVVRDHHTNIPRGFFTQAEQGDNIQLLVVGLNPGQPMEKEKGLYGGISADEMVKTHLQHVESAYFGGKGKAFHRRLLSWLEEIINKPKNQIFRSVVYTNLVKCTTPNNRKPSPQLSKICFGQHLQREISFWRPQVIVALGTACSDVLRKLGIDHLQLPHPSHRKPADFHRPFLIKLKERLRTQNSRFSNG